MRRHGQSRRLSLVEALANVAVGYLVALAAQLVIFPTVGLQVSLAQNLVIELRSRPCRSCGAMRSGACSRR